MIGVHKVRQIKTTEKKLEARYDETIMTHRKKSIYTFTKSRRDEEVYT